MKPEKERLEHSFRPRFTEQEAGAIRREAVALGLTSSAYIRLLVRIAIQEDWDIRRLIDRAA